ncbi:LTA synthase family protein [Marinicella rhabdoformis]|uniref:LTA synthase family protein n=1 Tax=Marinicella rhabdoformis TaxID=2580566 RepID=UPI001C553E3E|nr:LTA synthase family protein [Marinicella rhabdoformis]
MDTPVLPIDIIQIRELLQSEHLMASFIPILLAAVSFIFLVSAFVYKYDKPLIITQNKYYLLAFLLLVTSLFLTFKSNINQNLRKNGIFYKKNSYLPAHYLTKGIATSFFQILFFSENYPKPKGYSKLAIQNIINKYQLNVKSHTPKISPNLIILMVESLTDPKYFGWKTNQSNMQTLHKLTNEGRQSTAYSPVYGGKSINAEFELLTGMSLRYTNPESLVYRESIKQPVPSIAQTLRNNKYNTFAFRDERIGEFGFKKIYDELGFEHTYSFVDKGHQQDPTGKYTSSIAIADKIIATVEENAPAFVFTFTMSSHAPWNGKEYDSQLDFLYPKGISKNEKRKMKGYLNAINHMDKGIEKLIQHFKLSDKQTALLVIGDHQPHLKVYNKNIKTQLVNNNIKRVIKKHSLPYYYWDNFTTTKQLSSVPISFNFVSSLLLNQLQIKSCGLLKFNAYFHQFYEVFGSYIKLSKKGNNSIEFDTLKADYELLQYDVVYGENHQNYLLNKSCQSKSQAISNER